jgi:hypothetical protein
MIILTDKKLVIPVGIAPNYAGAGNSDIKLQSKSVTINENGSKSLFPDDNYDGFSQVNITTNVVHNPVLEDKRVEIIENGDYTFTPGPAYDGIGNFKLMVNVETYDPISVQSVKTAYPSFEEDVKVVPSEGYDAMSSVIVKKAEVNLQNKTVDKASTSEIVLNADSGYQGLGTVTVAPIKTSRIDVDPSTNAQVFNADTEDNAYITAVSVNPVTASIDSNITPNNILRGVNILGVIGEVDVQTDNFNDLVNSVGAAFTVKMKVQSIYSTENSSGSMTSNEGDYGYIRFFSSGSDYDSLTDRGIIAYAVNGELHRVTDAYNWYIPYTKQSNEYDDVVVDVYLDFEQAGRWCASKEGEDYETSPYYGGSYEMYGFYYYYLTPIINFESTLYSTCEIEEMIVRNTVNAIGYRALYNSYYGDYGILTFEPCADGIKRFFQDSYYSGYYHNPIYIYGDVEEFIDGFIDQSQGYGSNNKVVDALYAEIYGNIENYGSDWLTNVDLLNTKFHGTITTSSSTDLLLYKVTDDAVDFYEGCYKNDYSLGDKKRVIVPASCGVAFFNKPYYNGRYFYNKTNEEIVFFSTTPPSLPYWESGYQQNLSTNDPATNDSNLKRIFIPAGSNYDSILREAPYRPEVIEFTPITDLSTISRAGYYGYTAPDGSHTLLNIATTSQAELDIETIASEINNL